jgi:hypothetical protein
MGGKKLGRGVSERVMGTHRAVGETSVPVYSELLSHGRHLEFREVSVTIIKVTVVETS